MTVVPHSFSAFGLPANILLANRSWRGVVRSKAEASPESDEYAPFGALSIAITREEVQVVESAPVTRQDSFGETTLVGSQDEKIVVLDVDKEKALVSSSDVEADKLGVDSFIANMSTIDLEKGAVFYIDDD